MKNQANKGKQVGFQKQGAKKTKRQRKKWVFPELVRVKNEKKKARK